MSRSAALLNRLKREHLAIALAPPSRKGSCALLTIVTLPLTGRSRGGQAQWVPSSDLPGRAEAKVAQHFLDRRDHPSSKEGPKRVPVVDIARASS
jgi:hypothetical protein